MMKAMVRASVVSCVSLLMSIPAAAAIAELTLIPTDPEQAGYTGDVNLGVVVVARTTFFILPHTLSAGAGFTATCEGSSLSIVAERAFQITDFGSLQLVVTATNPTPKTYNIPGFGNLQQDTCAQCSFQYTGRAVEASASISVAGAGASFTLSVADGNAAGTDTAFFYACNPAPCNEGP